MSRFRSLLKVFRQVVVTVSVGKKFLVTTPLLRKSVLDFQVNICEGQILKQWPRLFLLGSKTD